MEEIWKDIEGYKGLYKISNLGNVKNSKDKLLKFDLSKNGYNRITLYKNTISKKHSIHRLVGLHFVSNPDNKPQINHLDSNPLNNIYTNLEWTTQSENIKYAYNVGRKKSPLFDRKKGKNNPQSIKIMQYSLYWDFIAEYGSICEAERLTGINQSNISRCLNNPLKHAGKYRWKTHH